MANVHGFKDVKKGSNGPPEGNQGGQGSQGGPPGGFGGFLGSMFGGGHSANEGNVKHFNGDVSDFQAEIKNAGGRLVVVDFSANWCGPCKMIAPHFAQLSQQYTNAVFLKIDVDQNNEVAGECGARSIPFFQFYKGGKKVAEFAGANPDKLKQTIEAHYTTGSASTSGSKYPSGGYVLGSASSQSQSQAPPTHSQPQQPQEDEMDQLMIRSLVDMGFSTQKAIQGLKATGGNSVEAAMDWCFNHPDTGSTEDDEDEEFKQALTLSQQTAPTPVQQPTQPTPSTTTESKHASTAIQVRLPDGNIIKASFKPTDTLRSVHAHVSMLTQNSKFSLMTNFPRKVYSLNDPAMDTTLQQAELVPTGTLIVSKQ